MFSGTVRVRVCEATGLRPTDFQKRHNMTFGKPGESPARTKPPTESRFVQNSPTDIIPISRTNNIRAQGRRCMFTKMGVGIISKYALFLQTTSP